MKFRSALILLVAVTPCAAFLPSTPAFARRHDAFLTAVTDAATPEVEHLDNSAVLVKIPVPGDATKAAYDKVCVELSKTVQIPGFRKGSKIPPQVLEQSMAAKGGRNALKVQAITELVGELVEPALKDQALEPIGQPTLHIPAEELAESFVAGEALELQVKCDVWPEIQWKEAKGEEACYVGLKGKYKRKPFNQEKLNLALRDLKERYATLEPITDDSHTLAMGDACTINMVGYLGTEDGEKGEPLPNAASGDNVEVILGKGRYMEGLVEGLVGAKKGEQVTIKVNFPEKLRDKSLAGKLAIFDVNVLEASTRIIPELTDAFAENVRAGLTAESLKEELQKAVDQEDSKEFLPARNKVLGEALADVMEVDVPDTLVTNQAREKFAMMMAEMRDGGVSDAEIKKQINPDNFLKYKDIVKGDIIRDFKISMATDEIARLESITVPPYQVEEQMESIRKDAQGEELDEKMLRGKVETTLQRQAVFNFLADKAELEVEFAEEDEEFDEGLMEKLADETMKREKGSAPIDPAELKTEAAAAAAVESSPTSTEKKEAAPAVKPKDVSKDSLPDPEEEANMSLEERAFSALMNSGVIDVNVSPDDPEYDSSADDEVADGTVFTS